MPFVWANYLTMIITAFKDLKAIKLHDGRNIEASRLICTNHKLKKLVRRTPGRRFYCSFRACFRSAVRAARLQAYLASRLLAAFIALLWLKTFVKDVHIEFVATQQPFWTVRAPKQ